VRHKFQLFEAPHTVGEGRFLAEAKKDYVLANGKVRLKVDLAVGRA